MRKLHIVYATDSRYLFPTQVAGSSAVAHAPDRRLVAIHILDCGLSEVEWSQFEDEMRRSLGCEFTLERHRIEMSTFCKFSVYHTSRATYARLLIPNLLEKEDWCLYADGDTLFTDDPLKLVQYQDDNLAIIGHADITDSIAKNWYLERKLPWDDSMHVCAGFILMNLKYFRECGGTEKALALLEKYPDMPYADQDALNVVFRSKMGLLPDEWGLFSCCVNSSTAPGVIHYARERPWERTLGDKMPLTAKRMIWIETMVRVSPYKRWEYAGDGWWSYFIDVLKTWSCRMPRVLLYNIPAFRSRCAFAYDDFLLKKRIREFLPK